MRSTPRLRLRHFTTTPGATSHAAWVERPWPSIGALYRTTPREPFAASAVSLLLGDVIVHRADFTAQHWVRDADLIAANDPGTLNVAITLAGRAAGVMGDRPFRTGPGSVHFVDLSQTSRHDSSASRTILLAVSRRLAIDSGLDVAALHGVVVRSAAGAALIAYLERLLQTVDSYCEEDAPLLSRAILDLLVLTERTAEPESAQAVRRAAAAQAARTLIDAHLGSGNLTVTHLCRDLDLSRTSLHRLFDDDGGVRAYIRNRRLEAVHHALTRPGSDDAIQDLADRFGFSDAAHLSRAFRARYGISPSVYRRQLMGLAPM
ncbi:helix-turn-helix domain-containing protein [Sphingomonas mali]|uniref:helix-turn-helix domain-containing protein n=1 Tax=Sphingomonas mali TaxID=40682 RepID=UPI0008352865|nr:helix-turn-helix domain-containing protein [Sphingomonas mali]